MSKKNTKTTKYRAVDYLSGLSMPVPQGPKFLWHSPRTLDLKYENENAITNQIEGLPLGTC